MTAPGVLVEVVRSGLVESVHHVTLVLLDESGSVEASWGDPTGSVFPRSALKPLQAVAMVESGLAVDGELLAIACASHDGAGRHVDLVHRLLESAGVAVDALRCPQALPETEAVREEYLRSGGQVDRLRHECSGKHAAMLATCVCNHWPIETYLDVSHPLQMAIRDEVERLTDERVRRMGVDGCGTPVPAITLVGLARAYSRITTATRGGAASAVAAAMTAFPEVVAGPGRDVTELMRATVGLIAKDGAEGVYAAALPDGRAAAFKIADGGLRAAPPVLCAVLRRWGFDNAAVAGFAEEAVYGGQGQVGSVRVREELSGSGGPADEEDVRASTRGRAQVTSPHRTEAETG